MAQTKSIPTKKDGGSQSKKLKIAGLKLKESKTRNLKSPVTGSKVNVSIKNKAEPVKATSSKPSKLKTRPVTDKTQKNTYQDKSQEKQALKKQKKVTLNETKKSVEKASPRKSLSQILSKNGETQKTSLTLSQRSPSKAVVQQAGQKASSKSEPKMDLGNQELQTTKVTAKVEKVKKSLKSGLSKASKAALVEGAQWQDLYEKFKDSQAQKYDMRARFEPNKPLNHKILGWGWILNNENDRLEVLFKDGKKILISNYGDEAI